MFVMKKRLLYLLIFPFLSLYSCEGQAQKESNQFKNQFNEKFRKYWYNGEAELNTYHLKQVRYGEEREGEAVLVFVTEDFLTTKQVKKESNTSADATSVLKLNFIRKFPTGIYDYSMLTSTFSPINQKKFVFPIKSTSSSQEWCGHSWLQFNLKADNYKYQSFSYFESEADEDNTIKKGLLEDGLWNQIRINDELIPTGELEIVPSFHYLRFAHKEIMPYSATIKKGDYLLDDMGSKKLKEIVVTYPGLERKLQIIYEAEFPNQIIGWKETRNSWGKLMTTTATLKGQLNGPYWNQNSNSDTHLRDSLNLK